MRDNRCLRVSGVISDAINQAKMRREIDVAPLDDYQAVVKALPKHIREVFGDAAPPKVSMDGSHIEGRRAFAQRVLDAAGIQDTHTRSVVERTVSFADEKGNVYIPDEADVLRTINALPQEYKTPVAAAIGEALEEAVKPKSLKKLEQQGLTKEAEELKTRAFQVRQYLDGTLYELETYIDLNDTFELDRMFKRAEAGDANAQKVVKRLQERYEVSSPQMAKAALWADVAERNPELIAKDYSDEISKRIKNALYQTGEFNGLPKLERQAIAQEFLEYTMGLRKLDELDPRLSEWLQRNNLVGSDGRFIGSKRPISRPDLAHGCPYTPKPKRSIRKVKPKADEGGAETTMGAAVSAALGAHSPEEEAIGSMLRAAYTEDELQQVAQFMRLRGYSVPEGSSKEDMFKILGNPDVYKQPPITFEPVSIPAGEMPQIDPLVQRMLDQTPPVVEDLGAAPPSLGDDIPPPVNMGGGEPPFPPPSDPLDDVIAPDPTLLSVEGAPKEVAEAFAALTQHPKMGFKSSIDADTGALLIRGVLSSDFRSKGIAEMLRSIGANKGKTTHPLNVPIAEKINQNSRFFEAKEKDGVYRFKLKTNAQAALDVERQSLRQDIPLLNLFEDEVVDGFILAQDLGQALLMNSPSGLRFYEQLLIHRLMMYPTTEDYETLLPVLAAHFGTGSIDDLLKRLSPDWIALTKSRLVSLVGRHRVYAAISGLISKQGFAQIGDEVITAEQWDALNDFERMALVENIASSPEMRKQLMYNFLGDVEQMERFFTSGDVSSRIDEAPPEIYYQNPANVASLVAFAKEMGIDPSALITGAKLLYDHLRLWDALWRRAGSYGIDMSGKVITPEEMGGNFIKAFYRMLAEKLQQAGYGDAADIIFSILENHDVLGWDVLQRLLNNEFPQELEALFGRAVDNLGQALVLQDEFYHKSVNKNLAELFVPIFAALGRPSEVVNPATGQKYTLNPVFPMISLHPYGGSYQSIGAIVQQIYGMSKKEFYERIMRSLPKEIQEAYYKLKQIGKEDTFDLYAPQIVADILRGSDIKRIQDGWNFLNDLYKMNLVVYSPRTFMRNFFTNILLMSRSADASVWNVIKEYREAFESANQNSRLYRELTRVETAFSGKAMYTEGSEALLFGLNAYQRMMSRLSSHKIFGAPVRLQAMTEGMGKYALMRMLLKRKYGKDWERLYTQEDFYEALRTVNEWMVDYRFVPPAIDYLRRILGFFPFITFLYTISSTLLTNPEKLASEVIRTGRLMWYAERLATLDQQNHTIEGEEEELLPPHLRHNPLLIKWRTPEGKVYALDLTFWVPLGVFEGFSSAGVKAFDAYKEALKSGQPVSELQALIRMGGAGLLHLGEWAMAQTGSIIRPVVEVMANRSLLTDQPLYEPLDPPMVKTEKIIKHLLTQFPLIRDSISAVNPQFFPRGKAWEEPENALEWIWANFLSGRKMSLDALAAQKFEQYKNQIQQYKAAISRISREPHMNPDQKERFIQQYLRAIEELIHEYETEVIYYLPKYYPEAGKDVYTDPLWYETIEEALDEYEPAFGAEEELE